jgi:hypothetical protein
MRETSIEVFEKIQALGILSKVDLAVYRSLFEHGPMTQGESWKEHHEGQYMRHTVGPAFARLKLLGSIIEVGKRACRLTGETCYIWDITGNMPQRLTSRERLVKRIIAAKSRIEKLELELKELDKKSEISSTRDISNLSL